jgi:hypothetical protein
MTKPLCIHRTLALLLLALAAGCGGTDIGESCDDTGSADECVDDAICTNEEDDRSRCRMLCEEHEDCPASHSCNGISNSSLKSCQPD